MSYIKAQSANYYIQTTNESVSHVQTVNNRGRYRRAPIQTNADPRCTHLVHIAPTLNRSPGSSSRTE